MLFRVWGPHVRQLGLYGCPSGVIVIQTHRFVYGFVALPRPHAS